MAAGLCFSFLVPMSAAKAVEIVAPGETLEFTQADDGARECRIKNLKALDFTCGAIGTVWRGVIPIEISLDPFIATGFNAARREARAAFSTLLIEPLPALVPHYATGAVYNDFKIDDPLGAEKIADVQFAIKYSWEGLAGGAVFYEVRIALSIEVEDISDDPNNPTGIGSFDLVSRDRQGDQGVTDVAAGTASYDRENDTASFSLKLRSGGTYRSWFKAEAYGFPLPLVRNVEAAIRGSWTELSVTVDEDDTELLLGLQDDLEQHDIDIKKLLAKQQGQLKKIIFLLKDDDDDDDDDRRRRRKRKD